MQWLLIAAGIAILLFLAHRPVSQKKDRFEEQIAKTSMKSIAESVNSCGKKRIFVPVALLKELEKDIRWLSLQPKEELFPAARRLCENGRAIQEQAAAVILQSRTLPAFPRSPSGKARMQLFASGFFQLQSHTLSRQALQQAIHEWQNTLPMTHDELHYLSFFLQLELLDSLKKMTACCVRDHQAYLAAGKAHTLKLQGREKAFQKLYRRFENSSTFKERLFRLEGNDVSAPKELDALLSQEHTHQEELCLQIGSIISSFRHLQNLPWQQLTEECSLIHASFGNDKVYRSMDEESRAYYRFRLSRIALWSRLPEQTVCTRLLSLCQALPSDSLKAHIGYYLLDEGFSELIARLKPQDYFIRFRLFCQKHSLVLFRTGSWSLFLSLLFLAFRENLPMTLLVPFAALFLYYIQQIGFRLLEKNVCLSKIPCMQLHALGEENQTLVLCPAVLTSESHAIAMVKRMSIMHEANPDDHLHFLLLGDFPDSLTAKAPDDDRILSAAAAAVEALCRDTGHPFAYIQRERIFFPEEYTHNWRKYGGIETTLRLIEGKSIQDSFSYSSIDLSSLKHKYRYVITLNSDALLPPGSVLQMVGAMLHPLQKKQILEGELRGTSILQPHTQPAAPMKQTLLGRLLDVRHSYNFPEMQAEQILFHSGTFTGNGIIDPSGFLQEIEGSAVQRNIAKHKLLKVESTGCAVASNIVLSESRPQTLKEYLHDQHHSICVAWQMLACILPQFPKHILVRSPLVAHSQWKIRRTLFRSLIPLLRLVVLAYALFEGNGWLFTAAAFLPEIPFLSFSADSLLAAVLHLAMLPCDSFVHTSAICRTLWQAFVSRRKSFSEETVVQLSQLPHKPPMQFFYANMSCAIVFALLSILTNAFWQGGFPLAVLWAVFPFVKPYMEQEQTNAVPTQYMREVLGRIARNTLTFFETSITEEDNGLPTACVQIDPNKGIAHGTSPTNIGLYLCSLIACERMKLLSANEAALRIESCVDTLDRLPKWRGLFYHEYDTRTLQILSPETISSMDCGNLAVCLLSCAQGLRVLLPKLNPVFHTLSERIDQLVAAMDLKVLYDHQADLFHVSLQPQTGKPSYDHYDLLASESRLLSFIGIALGQIPPKHWQYLGRQQTARHALLSQNGAMAEYLFPLLFQPLIPHTLLEQTCRQALRAQRKYRISGSFGISKSGCYQFDPDLNYQYRTFGIPELSLNSEAEYQVIAPYASFLSMMVNLKVSFHNLLRLQALGLEGPLGLFEAADFDQSHTNGKSMEVVRSHMGHHQGMILLALCNVLEDNYIAKLFSSLPCVQAHHFLLQEKPNHEKALVRHPIRSAVQEDTAVHLMQRSAVPLCFPIDAHLLGGGGTSLAVDAQGHGFLKHENIWITRFSPDSSQPSGIRIYLKDSENGAFWTATDPYLNGRVTFEAQQIDFVHQKSDLLCELRIWINPLDGTCLHCLNIENQSKLERVLEVCSYLEPSLSSTQEESQHPLLVTERLGTRGLACICPSVNSASAFELWHQLSSSVPLTLFRVQCDRSAFLGRGRSFLSPRAMNTPISAIPDCTGSFEDVCISLRGQFVLPASERAVFLFSTHLCKNGEKVSSFMERYAQIDCAKLSYDAALTRAMVSVRHLRLSTDLQAEISRLTGALCWKNPFRNPPMPSLQTDSVLHRLSVKTDLPIVLCTCSDSIHTSLVSGLLKAHAFHRMNGLAWTLIVLMEVSSRAAALVYEAETLAEESGTLIPRNTSGGLYILAHQSKADQEILKSVSQVVFSCNEGGLTEQLNALSFNVCSAPLYTCKPDSIWKSTLPGVSQRIFENSFGGFTDGDYQIHLSPGRHAPAPWCNLLCSGSFGTIASETGLLSSRILTKETVPSVRPFSTLFKSNENFFIRDQQHRLIWSLTRLPLGHGLDVRVTHRPGETLYEGSGYGIDTQISCFTQDSMGIRHITIKNTGEEARTLTLCHVCIFPWDVICMEDHLYTVLPEDAGTLALFAVDPAGCTVSCLPSAVYQGLGSIIPYGLACMEQWPKSNGNVALLSYELHLEPGESAGFTNCIVHAGKYEKLVSQVEVLRTEGAGRYLRNVRSEWESSLSLIHFDLPDQALALLLNRWLVYQTKASMLWTGTAWYDQPQDLLCLLLTHPAEVRQRLLHIAGVLWEEAGNQNLAAKLRLLFTAGVYLSFTHDESIGSEIAVPSSGKTLLELCEEIVETFEAGAHGLPMDAASNQESVCAGMMLCEIIRRFSPFFMEEIKNNLLAKREELITALERFAWNGAWYLSGWSERGQPIGCSSAQDGFIDLEPQIWSVLCGVSRERCEIAMESVWNHLYERKTGLIRKKAFLFDHSEQTSLSSNETDQHTALACLAAAALHQLGQNARAWEWIGALMPTNHTATKQLALRYKAEPYVMPEFVQATETQQGQAKQTWFSHSSASFWCVLVMQLLGLQTEGNLLRFRPCVPPSWDDLTITYRYGSATYHLHASRDTQVLHADGEDIPEGILVLSDDGKIHEATFPIR